MSSVTASLLTFDAAGSCCVATENAHEGCVELLARPRRVCLMESLGLACRDGLVVSLGCVDAQIGLGLVTIMGKFAKAMQQWASVVTKKPTTTKAKALQRVALQKCQDAILAAPIVDKADKTALKLFEVFEALGK